MLIMTVLYRHSRQKSLLIRKNSGLEEQMSSANEPEHKTEEMLLNYDIFSTIIRFHFEVADHSWQ
jgi:hypothetical protein